MFQYYNYTVADRFLRYVQIDTQSNPLSDTRPSTEKQKDLSRLLTDELQAMGIADAAMDEWGYVYATIPSNTGKKVPVICFCAHVDTSPDSSGAGVKPLIHQNYNGLPIHLPDDPKQIIDPADHPYLKKKIGGDIITASGTTLLGADDKAGVAVIMDMCAFFQNNPGYEHGTIKILFTPDEEIGRGADNIDLVKLGADYAYTLDAGELGSFEDETFSADSVTITIHGISAHPGYAKGKLVNALKIGSRFLNSLPKESFSPETSSDREGFVHPVRMEGISEKLTIEFIIRDFETARLKQYEQFLEEKLKEALALYPGAYAEFQVKEQYRNMKEIIDLHPAITTNAHEAMKRAGVTVISQSARGGTDGSRLSFMGLPCPNIFTGEMAFHGKHEYVCIQDMQKSVQTIVHLAMIWAEKS